MIRRIKRRNYLCPSETIPRFASERGVVLIVLMMVVTILLIALTAALPSVYTEGQREREKETIFRGNQYARAILAFRQRFGRFPMSVSELVKPTNGIRFLRQAYSDPLDPKGVWRFIHANANGVLTDSLTMGVPHPPTPMGNSSQNQSPNLPGLNTLSEEGNQDENAPDQNNQNDQNSSQVFSNQPVGNFIAGVAPTSKAASILIYNKQDRYNMWEFIGIPQAAAGGIPQLVPNAPQQNSPGGPVIPTMPPLINPPSGQQPPF